MYIKNSTLHICLLAFLLAENDRRDMFIFTPLHYGAKVAHFEKLIYALQKRTDDVQGGFLNHVHEA